MFININDNQFKVKLCKTQKEKSEGMMGKKFGSKFKAMLFLMGGDKHCFWMKNCIIPLDIIFIKDMKIIKIHHSCPPCEKEECKNYCGNGDLVLELMGGTCKSLDINKGDKITINK